MSSLYSGPEKTRDGKDNLCVPWSFLFRSSHRVEGGIITFLQLASSVQLIYVYREAKEFFMQPMSFQ
jgi:hypothetical protein